MTIKDLTEKHGKVPYPEGFGQDGNALSLVSITKRALTRGGWPQEARSKFAELALSGDYDNVINSCLGVFAYED